MTQHGPRGRGALGHTRHVRRHYQFLDHTGPLAFAHRGGTLDGLENTMPAFQRAVDLGYRYLETDVHATADGVLLAFHDHTLDRVTDRTGRVAVLPYAEVRRARIGGREPIPLLGDLLGAWPDVRVNIDVKEASAVGPLVSALRRTNAFDRVCVASFSERRIAAVRAALGARVCTALGPRGVTSLWVASRAPFLGLLARGGVPCAQVPSHTRRVRVVTPAFVAAAHRLGVQVHVWTVNDQTEMRRLLDAGVDGIFTDELEGLRDVLAERGAWGGS
ncbi:MAG: glycerophosphodiester phosphodiesterase [Streptosporangiaceae bacterium]